MGRLRDMHLLADEDLMALVARRDAGAFEAVYDRHADRAFALAYRMLGSRGSAEDVVQEAFLSVWRSGQRYAPSRGGVRTWLMGIVHHRAVDAVRRRVVHERGRSGDDETLERQPSTELTDVEVARREDSRLVRTALTSLPDDQSRVIELAYFGGFTHNEIAEMLDIPLGTVKGRMRLGLEKMYGQLAEAAS